MYRKPYFIVLFAAVLLLLAVLVFQGGLLKRLIADRAYDTLGLRVKIRDITVMWLKSDLQIEGLVATGPRGFESEPMITADTVYVRVDRKAALSGRLRFKRIFLVIPEITVVRNASGAVNVEEVKHNARRQASVGKRGSGPGKEDKAHVGKPAFIQLASLRLGKVTFKDDSGGGPPFVRTFPLSVSEIRVRNVTWDDLAAGLGVLAAVGRSGPGPLIKAMSGARSIGDRMDEVLKGVEKRLKEAR